MADATINVLLATFAGLGLPRTLSLPTKASAPIGDVYNTILDRLPVNDDRLLITTVSNKQLTPSDHDPISSLLSCPTDTLLSLRLHRRLCGGKGGFGSQLRAAGGRMSSRKNRNQNQNPNGSNRNLDGRRLRTVDEAKKLADYLAIKPEMEKKEKEERKRRWEEVVEAAERREEEIKRGKTGANQGRLDAQYVEGKELAEEKTREAVMRAMRENMLQTDRTGSESDVEEPGSEVDAGEESSRSSDSAKTGDNAGRTFFGWDEEDDDESEEDDLEEQNDAYEGKGKGKAS